MNYVNNESNDIKNSKKVESNDVEIKNSDQKIKTKWKIKRLSESGENIEYVFDTKEEAINKIKSLSENDIEITEKDRNGNVVSKEKIIKN